MTILKYVAYATHVTTVSTGLVPRLSTLLYWHWHSVSRCR